MNNASDGVLKLVTAALASMAMLGVIYVGGRLILGDDILLPLEMVRSGILWIGGGALAVVALGIVGATAVGILTVLNDYHWVIKPIHPEWKHIVSMDRDENTHTFDFGQNKEAETEPPKTIDAPEWHTVPEQSLT